jgi:transcriptional repressor NrdR
MKCPHCGVSDSRVIDTRSSGERIRRRRECLGCHKRFTTYERVVLSNPIVVKRDGRREEFDPDKLALGVRKACAKRPISMEDLERLVDQVEAEVHRMGKVEIPSQVIGDLVMERLKELDQLAYILFASVYLPLTDLESMKAEVDRLLERPSDREGGSKR